MNKILIAEPLYHAMPPQVYFNRIAFWKKTFELQSTEEPNELDTDSFTLGRTFHTTVHYTARPLVMGPRRNIRSARDTAIRQALELGATHLLFMDDDILVPDDILTQLLAVDQPIVGGLIHKDDGTPVVYRDVRPTDDHAALETYAGYPVEEVAWLDHPKDQPFECAAIGAGVMLIQNAVLHNLLETDRWAFNYDDTLRSMDVRFCRKARKAGFSVWCSPAPPCTQIQHY